LEKGIVVSMSLTDMTVNGKATAVENGDFFF
jgi:hypothetical protein